MARFSGALVLLALLALPAQAVNRQVTVEDSRFIPAQLTIGAGDTVTWTNQGLLPHNVRADDESFRCANGCDDQDGNGNPSSANWSFTLTFDDPGSIPYFCEQHGAAGGVNMSGTITVEPAQEPEPELIPINFGHTGSWFKPEQDGQGFSLEVVPATNEEDPDQLVAYWFTFARGAPGGPNRQRWFIAQGPIDGTEAVLEVFQVTGGVFDDAQNVSSIAIGTATFRFTSCTEGSVSYSLDLDGDGEEEATGEIALTRLTPDVLCEDMAGGGS